MLILMALPVCFAIEYAFDNSDTTALEWIRNIFIASPLWFVMLLIYVQEHEERRKVQFDKLQRQIDFQADQIRQLDKELLAINVHPLG